MIQELQDRGESSAEGNDFFIAMIYGAARDTAKTLEWLEKSYQKHEFEFVWVKAYPEFHFLQANAQYEAILDRVGFPEKFGPAN